MTARSMVSSTAPVTLAVSRFWMSRMRRTLTTLGAASVGGGACVGASVACGACVAGAAGAACGAQLAISMLAARSKLNRNHAFFFMFLSFLFAFLLWLIFGAQIAGQSVPGSTPPFPFG